MNNETNPDTVFRPKKTPLLIGAVLLVLIVAIIVLSVFLLSKSGADGKDTESTPPVTTSDPVIQVKPSTPESSQTTGKTEPTPPITSGENTTSKQESGQNPPVETTKPAHDKGDPTTFSVEMDDASSGLGGQILVDENHGYAVPSEKLLGRTEMAKLSAETLKKEYNFVKVPESTSYLRKSGNFFLNTEACAAFQNMMDAFAAATGNKDVQLRNAYYYDKNEQICYNSTGLNVDLEINKDDGIYPLNYETFRSDYYDWFMANSYRFGFIHLWEIKSSTGHDQYSSFRYVGIPHATYMQNNNIELEDYLKLLESYTIDKSLTYTDDDGIAWIIYYVPKDSSGKTTVQLTAVPGSYTISGNNMGGYIVTIDTSYFK